MLRIVSNEEINKQQQAEAEAEVNARQGIPVIQGIAAYLRQCWDVALQAKRPIETTMLANMRQRNGEYEANILTEIQRNGGSEIFMRLTEVKCRAAESWLRDILMDTGSPPWDIQPTPIPELAPSQMEEIYVAMSDRVNNMLQMTGQAPTASDISEMRNMAEQEFRFKLLEAADRRNTKMKMKIKDQFAHGGFSEAFNMFITDLVTYPTAFMKGPIVRRQRRLGFDVGPEGRSVVNATEVLAPEFERVDPFNVYPEPGITDLNDGYLFEHHPLTRSELADMIGVPGYDDAAIRMILDHGAGPSWFHDTVQYQKNEEERKYYHYAKITTTFDALEFWGKLPGKMLREWGMDGIDDDAREYDANVWMVGNYVIKAMFNYDPLGEKPYVKSSFIKRPGAFWGSSICEVIADDQQMCNAAARALDNNMGLASGPQIVVNLDRLPANEPIEQIYPWKIWQIAGEPLGANSPAIDFQQPDDNAQSLMAVFERFSRLADDHSGIPAYVHGDTDVQGAGRTSSGLSMLMGAAGKGIRQVVMHLDHDVIKPIVYRQYVYNLRYDEDESIKGDAEVMPRGAVNLAVKETVNTRRIEFLQATANDIDMQIVGLEGRRAILQEVAKGLQMPVDDIVPSKEKFSFAQKMQQQQQQQQQPQEPGQEGVTPAPAYGPTPAPSPTQTPDPAELFPGGNPMGGEDGNVVSNQFSGRS